MRHGNATLLQLAPVTCAILAANTMLFIIEAQHAGSMSRFSTDVLLSMGASQRELLWEGEWQRLVAPVFLHGGLMHIILNSIGIYQFGSAAETHFGSSNYGTLYLLSGIVGVCFSQMFGNGVAVGASGAVFGLMTAEFVVLLMQSPVIRYAWRRSEVRVSFAWLCVYLMMGVSGMMGNIDNWGHLGGAVAGGFLAVMFEMWRTHKRMGLPLLCGFLLLIAATIALARWSVYSPAYHIHTGLLAANDKRRDEANHAYAQAQEWANVWGKDPAIAAIVVVAKKFPEETLSVARDYGYANLERIAPQLLMEMEMQSREDKDQEL